MSIKSVVARILPLVALLTLGSTTAHAGWILVGDESPEDGGTIANNPAQLPREAPYNNDPQSIAVWLQDLENLDSPPSLISAGDVGSGSGTWTLNNIDAAAVYLTLHYGNFPGGFGLSSDFGNVMIAFRCVQNEVSCSSFSAPWRGLSNYRIYGSTAVPEPATLALLGAGLVGMGLARRRRRASAA